MRARQGGLIAALVFHAALFVLLSHSPRKPPRAPAKATDPPLQVRLIPSAPPKKVVVAPQPVASPPARVALPIRVPKKIGVENPALPGLASVVEPAPTSAPLAESQLKLDNVTRASPTASPPSVRDQAMRDPRANTQRLTPAERFAQALGGSDERLTEENQGNGRIIVRKGRDCYDVRVARNAELDPYSQSTRPTGKVVMSCR